MMFKTRKLGQISFLECFGHGHFTVSKAGDFMFPVPCGNWVNLGLEPASDALLIARSPLVPENKELNQCLQETGAYS